MKLYYPNSESYVFSIEVINHRPCSHYSDMGKYSPMRLEKVCVTYKLMVREIKNKDSMSMTDQPIFKIPLYTFINFIVLL